MGQRMGGGDHGGAGDEGGSSEKARREALRLKAMELVLQLPAGPRDRREVLHNMVLLLNDFVEDEDAPQSGRPPLRIVRDS